MVGDDGNQCASPRDALDATIERRLRELVRSWGLSRFSEEMAWRWLCRSLASTPSPDDDNDANNQRHGHDDEDRVGDPCARVRQWVLMQLNRQRRPLTASPWQLGCPDLVPSLRAQSVWPTRLFPFVRELEAAFPRIRDELLALKGQRGFQPYRAPTWASDIHAADGLGSLGHDAGDWNVFYLYLHNVDFAANRALCPDTSRLIAALPGHYDHAFFSALAPQTHIKKHHGPTNKKLRCHLPLVVPPGQCRLRVGEEVVHIEEGKCFIFDDSFEHEAWNDDPAHARITLIVDLWHPEFSAPERKFLQFLRNAQLRMDKRQAQESKDNFFTIIETANQANLAVDAAIWS